MKNIPHPIENIKAESYLTSFLASCLDVNIEPLGVFSRNYSEDVMLIEYGDDANHRLNVQLSRDSVFNILPEGLFFEENKLRDIGKQNNAEKFREEEERIIKEKKKIRLFFQPFDTVYFRLRFELEKSLNELSANRTQLIFDEIFDVFPLDTDNSLIHKIMPLLPLASEIRGNNHLLKDVLRGVFFPAKVELFRQRKRKPSDSRVKNVLKINVFIEKLSAGEFRNMKEEADVFAQFLYDWFLPVDCDYEFKIKDKSERFVLGKTMTLDYNTYL